MATGLYTYTFEFGPPFTMTAFTPKVALQLNVSPEMLTLTVWPLPRLKAPLLGGSSLNDSGPWPKSAQLGLNTEYEPVSVQSVRPSTRQVQLEPGGVTFANVTQSVKPSILGTL